MTHTRPLASEKGIVQCQQPMKNLRKISNLLRLCACPKLKVSQMFFTAAFNNKLCTRLLIGRDAHDHT